LPIDQKTANDFMTFMKFLSFFALLSIFSTIVSQAKPRAGSYILGFGYSMAEGDSGDREGDFFRLTAQAPNGASSDIGVYLDYGTMESGGQDASSWNVGADYLANFSSMGGYSAQLTPYLGAGLGYLNDEKPIRLGDDGFTWSLLLGSEIKFSNALSLNLAGRFFGLWSDFGENEFTADAAITWWFNNMHGASIEYQRAFEAEANYFTVRYLYSWQ
jgi:hypothetical protein